MANNGVMKHLERLRKMVNLAVRLEWLPRNPFSALQLKFQKGERQFLTAEELRLIEEKDFHIERIQMVKDLFIFSCYTGLAYVDVSRSEEHTSELQSLMRISYAVFVLKKKNI